jgi:hypothetical protein
MALSRRNYKLSDSSRPPYLFRFYFLPKCVINATHHAEGSKEGSNELHL